MAPKCQKSHHDQLQMPCRGQSAAAHTSMPLAPLRQPFVDRDDRGTAGSGGNPCCWATKWPIIRLLDYATTIAGGDRPQHHTTISATAILCAAYLDGCHSSLAMHAAMPGVFLLCDLLIYVACSCHVPMHFVVVPCKPKCQPNAIVTWVWGQKLHKNPHVSTFR